MKYLWALLLSGVMMAPAALATESVWPVHKGSIYIEMQPTLAFFSNDQPAPVTDLSFYNRIEVGILENTSIFFSLPMRSLAREQSNPGNNPITLTNNGLTDIHLGTYIQVLPGPLSLTLKAAFKIPTGYNPTFLPSIGDRQLDLHAGLLAGYTFDPVPAYVQAGLGYTLRTPFDQTHPSVVTARLAGDTIRKPADQIALLAEGGIWFTPSWFASLSLSGDLGLNQAEALSQSLLVVRPLLAYRLTPEVDVSLQFEQAIWSNNAPYLTGMRLGGHFRFGAPRSLSKGLRGGIASYVVKDED